MLQFAYQPVPLAGPPPPSLPPTATVHSRPFVSVSISGPTGSSRYFNRALVDPGSDDCIFPLAIVSRLGVSLRPDTGHSLRWHGQPYRLRFGDADFQLTD